MAKVWTAAGPEETYSIWTSSRAASLTGCQMVLGDLGSWLVLRPTSSQSVAPEKSKMPASTSFDKKIPIIQTICDLFRWNTYSFSFLGVCYTVASIFIISRPFGRHFEWFEKFLFVVSQFPQKRERPFQWLLKLWSAPVNSTMRDRKWLNEWLIAETLNDAEISCNCLLSAVINWD